MSFSIDVKISPFRSESFSINPPYLNYGTITLDLDKIAEFSYSQADVSEHVLGHQVVYQIVIKEKYGPKIIMTFIDATFADSGKGRVKYDEIIQRCWEAFGNRLLQEMKQNLFKGKIAAVAQWILSREGISFEKKPLFRKPVKYTIPWSDLRIGYYSGHMIIESKAHSTATTKADQVDSNIMVFDSFQKWLFADYSRVQALMDGNSLPKN